MRAREPRERERARDHKVKQEGRRTLVSDNSIQCVQQSSSAAGGADEIVCFIAQQEVLMKFHETVFDPRKTHILVPQNGEL
eukprot:3194142-Rhodomonas_salina.1